jgi:hypothetical protein
MNILKSRIDEQHYWDGLVLQLKSTTISRVYKASLTHTLIWFPHKTKPEVKNRAKEKGILTLKDIKKNNFNLSTTKQFYKKPLYLNLIHEWHSLTASIQDPPVNKNVEFFHSQYKKS